MPFFKIETESYIIFQNATSQMFTCHGYLKLLTLFLGLYKGFFSSSSDSNYTSSSSGVGVWFIGIPISAAEMTGFIRVYCTMYMYTCTLMHESVFSFFAPGKNTPFTSTVLALQITGRLSNNHCVVETEYLAYGGGLSSRV